MKKIYFLGFCFAIFFKMVSAQDVDKKTISVNFQQASIEQFVTDLETKTGYHFYYNPPQFDSLKVTLQVTDKPLETVLGMAFHNTDFHYAITNHSVFLTKGRQLNTSLAPGFFSTQTVTAPAAAVTDYTEDKQTKVPEATTENKLYEIGVKTNNIKSGTATLAGYVRNIKTGEAIIGASIYNPDSKIGVATDQFGYYSLTLPRGRQTLIIKGLGLKDTRRRIVLYTDGKLNIDTYCVWRGGCVACGAYFAWCAIGGRSHHRVQRTGWGSRSESYPI
jgi:hypothetical protein